MSDREKVYFVNGGKYTKTEMVKKALYQCTLPSDSDGYEAQCADCPYFDPDCSVSVCKQQLCDDAIALLKQEAKQYNNHEVACILADLFGDPCACNFNDIDTWLPYKCDFRETCCPNPAGVACWEQYLKYKEGR